MIFFRRFMKASVIIQRLKGFCLIGVFCFPVHALEVDYHDIKPVLDQRCTMCHSGENAPLGLRLDSLDGLRNGSNNGPVAKPGNPYESELIRRLKGISTPRMPMTGPPYLSEETIARFEAWIEAGMPENDGRTMENGTPQQIISSTSRPAPNDITEQPGVVTYLDVAPIFARRCSTCHTDGGRMGDAPEGYRLTSYAGTLAASDRARIVPGYPEASELVRRIRGQARPRMPFDGPPYLEEKEIQLIENWIRQGARNAEGEAAGIPVDARVRLHGTLTERWSLDGLPLDVDIRTRLDKSSGTGNYVRIRGRVGSHGEILVERIQKR